MKRGKDIRPIIAITMGDAAGVGPEIVVKALAPSEKGAGHLSLPDRDRAKVDFRKGIKSSANSTHLGAGTVTVTPKLTMGGGRQLYSLCRPLVVGDANVLAKAEQMLGLRVDWHPIANVGEARFELGSIDVLDLANIDLANLKEGEVSPMTGRAAVEYVLKAGELALVLENDQMIRDWLGAWSLWVVVDLDNGWKAGAIFDLLHSTRHTEDMVEMCQL